MLDVGTSASKIFANVMLKVAQDVGQHKRSFSWLVVGSLHDDRLLAAKHMNLNACSVPYQLKVGLMSKPASGEDVRVVAAVLSAHVIGRDCIKSISMETSPVAMLKSCHHTLHGKNGSAIGTPNATHKSYQVFNPVSVAGNVVDSLEKRTHLPISPQHLQPQKRSQVIRRGSLSHDCQVSSISQGTVNHPSECRSPISAVISPIHSIRQPQQSVQAHHGGQMVHRLFPGLAGQGEVVNHIPNSQPSLVYLMNNANACAEAPMVNLRGMPGCTAMYYPSQSASLSDSAIDGPNGGGHALPPHPATAHASRHGDHAAGNDKTATGIVSSSLTKSLTQQGMISRHSIQYQCELELGEVQTSQNPGAAGPGQVCVRGCA